MRIERQLIVLTAIFGLTACSAGGGTPVFPHDASSSNNNTYDASVGQTTGQDSSTGGYDGAIGNNDVDASTGGGDTCPVGTSCQDDGYGYSGCFDSNNDNPANAVDCEQTGVCTAGYTCEYSLDGTTVGCVQDCGSGGGTPPTDTCPAGTICEDGDGAGNYGCFDSATDDNPAGAVDCESTDCPAGYSCWESLDATTYGCVLDCSGA